MYELIELYALLMIPVSILALVGYLAKGFRDFQRLEREKMEIQREIFRSIAASLERISNNTKPGTYRVDQNRKS